MVKNYIPKFIAKGKVFSKIYASQQAELDILNNNIKDLINNLFIETATWALEYWEKEYGITINYSDALDNRRARIYAAKRLRQTFNAENVKKLASAFSDEKVEVIPHLEEDYFSIEFTTKKGIDSRKLDDLYDIIDRFKFSHLDVEYMLIVEANCNIYCGTISVSGETITVYPYKAKDLESIVRLEVGNALDTQYEEITVYPKKKEE